MNVETHIQPPDLDPEEEGDDKSSRIQISLIGSDSVLRDAAVQLFDTNAEDPEKIAEALLNAALAVGHLAGPDVAWAVAARFAGYDGMTQ